MKVLLIYAHPEPKSFNGAMFGRRRETPLAFGHEVLCSDLYGMNFHTVSGLHNFSQPSIPPTFSA